MTLAPQTGAILLEEAQAQKHVTANEALLDLDAIVQLAVLDRDLTTAPGSPANGARYIIAGTGGAWSGKTLLDGTTAIAAGDIAHYRLGAWVFYRPKAGWRAYVVDEGLVVVWTGSAWENLFGSGAFETLGINASADVINRLAVKSNAVLFDHDGDDSRVKVNKATAGDTASHLFQRNYSGRAEFGLIGNDDFTVKVSPDGTNWFNAIQIDKDTGDVFVNDLFISGYALGTAAFTAATEYATAAQGAKADKAIVNDSGFQRISGTTFCSLSISGAAAQNREIRFETGASSRWRFGAGTAAETGGNAGSPAVISAYDDNGNFLATPYSISRDTNTSTFGSHVTVSGTFGFTVAQGLTTLRRSTTPQVVVESFSNFATAQLQISGHRSAGSGVVAEVDFYNRNSSTSQARLWTNGTGDFIVGVPAATEMMRFTAAGVITLAAGLRLESCTVATAGSASAEGAGTLKYCTDGDAGAECVIISNGTDWKVISLGATAATS